MLERENCLGGGIRKTRTVMVVTGWCSPFPMVHIERMIFLFQKAQLLFQSSQIKFGCLWLLKVEKAIRKTHEDILSSSDGFCFLISIILEPAFSQERFSMKAKWNGARIIGWHFLHSQSSYTYADWFKNPPTVTFTRSLWDGILSFDRYASSKWPNPPAGLGGELEEAVVEP